MRTHTSELVTRAALSVLDEYEAGRSVDPHRLQWANGILEFHRPKEKQVQEALDATLLYEIPTGEAKELPPDVAWNLWDLTVRLQDYEERKHELQAG